jgi:hypothetical protein
MKIRVQRRDGALETITLKGSQFILDGDTLDHFVSEHGREHFFTKDGYYDGWGQQVRTEMTMEQVKSEADLIELYRDIEQGPGK